MSNKAKDPKKDQSRVEVSQIADQRLLDLHQQLNEITRLLQQKFGHNGEIEDRSNLNTWKHVLNRILVETMPDFTWVKDASVSNLADGGIPIRAKVYLQDSAWISSWEGGPVFHHRYEVDFYEDRSPRAKLAVAFGLRFNIYDVGDSLESEFFALGDESEIHDPQEVFSKTLLYAHTWPQLRDFVEKSVGDFGWDPVNLPEQYSQIGIPQATFWEHNLPH